MKYLLIIGDGMADNPVAELGGMTPLEKAEKPFIDSLSERGELGNVKTVPDGFEPGSDVAIMSIFGCAPEKYFAGRAPLEAAAQGVKLSDGDAAFRCNIIALSEGDDFYSKTILSHSAGGIGGEEAKTLVVDLFNDPEFKALADSAGVTVLPSLSYRHLVVQKSVDINGISMSPPHDHLGEPVSGNLPKGCESAKVLEQLLCKASEILDKHPINVKRRREGKLPGNSIWFWAQGTAANLPSFYGQYNKTGAVISAVALCHGIAKLAGLDVILVDGATAELDTNYEGKVDAALDALKSHDFAAVHIEAPDECSHAKDVECKLEAIRRLDNLVVRPVIESLEKQGEDFRVLILSDHKTLVESGFHDGEPVPFIIYDSRVGNGSGLVYTEANGEAGLSLNDGTLLMERLFSK